MDKSIETSFYSDVRQRKNIANQARYRKNGTKSKKCTLFSDLLTEKEIKERHGEVMTYEMNKPMEWKKFKVAPADIQEQYLKGLILRYSANAKVISDMFNISPVTLFRLVKRNNLNVEFRRGYQMSESEISLFGKFLNGDICVEAEESDSEVCNNDETNTPECGDICNECNEPESEKVSNESNNDMKLSNFSLDFSGEIDVDSIANSLRYIIGNGNKAKVHIVCEFY